MAQVREAMIMHGENDYDDDVSSCGDEYIRGRDEDI